MDLEQSNWPNSEYAEQEFVERNIEFRINSERLMGRVESLPEEYQKDAVIDLMLSEAIKTSAIEGEVLDRESVRSSLLALIASESIPVSADQKAVGAAALLVDVRKNWKIPLTHEILGQWQSMSVPEQRLSLIMRGCYRNNPSPMQIVSGSYRSS